MNANFFEAGGDSLIAISVAMSAANEGLDLTPQDLYENPTIAALGTVLVDRYAAGGLARRTLGDAEHPPVPPNVEHFLERGLRDARRWRTPVVLQLDPGTKVGDVAAVLSAVTDHHDALRLRLVQRAGIWEQQIDEPLASSEDSTVEFTGLATASLPDETEPGSNQERQAVMDILNDRIRQPDATDAPLVATYVTGAQDGPCYLAISVHGVAGDGMSRDILLTDLFTAFGQRLAGEPIVLAPVATSWREWSQRCASLATHPAVVESRDFWLDTTTRADVWLTNGDPPLPPGPDDLFRLASQLAATQATEIDDARRRLEVTVDEILLAALSRTIALIVGPGVVAVDLDGSGRSVLKPDLDTRRTVGWLTTVYPLALSCAKDDGKGVRQLLDDVHETVKAVPHYGIGYGLLRYLHAPTARRLVTARPADIHFTYVGTIPDLSSMTSGDLPVKLDPDAAMPVRETIPGLGHPLELRVYRHGGVLYLDWWYDRRRIEPAVAQSFAERFRTELIELARGAIAEDETESSGDELELVDLSSVDAG